MEPPGVLPTVWFWPGHLSYREKLSALPGVVSVTWLDDVAGEDVLIGAPPEYLDASVAGDYYKDGHALFGLTIETGSEAAAVSAIYDLIGEHNAAAGDAVNAAATQEMAVSEVLKALAILVPIILIILTLFTTSWIKPCRVHQK